MKKNKFKIRDKVIYHGDRFIITGIFKSIKGNKYTYSIQHHIVANYIVIVFESALKLQ